MMKKTCIFVAVLLWISIISCERPSSPDFELQQTFDVPLVEQTQYKLIGGGKGAIIDTTNEDFQDLFAEGPDGLIFLSTEIDFEIGDVDDISPELSIDPTEFESEIGSLEIDDFSSSFESEIGEFTGEPEDLEEQQVEVGVLEIEFRASGTADFEQVTGLDAGAYGAGDPLPGPVEITLTIELDNPSFEEAVIESGGIRFFFDNDLGFDIQNMSATLISQADGDARPVGNDISFGAIPYGESRDDVVLFDQGEVLEAPMAFEVTVSWESQVMQDAPGEISAESQEENLMVRRATGTVSAQKLHPETEPISSSNPDFEYAIVSGDPGPDDEFDLELSIVNNTSLTLYDSILSGMPEITIINSDGQIIDEPKVLENLSRPGANQFEAGEAARVILDLTGQKITRELDYEISLGTTGGGGITVDRDDYFLVTPSTSTLKFVEARSDIDPQEDIPLEDAVEIKGDFVNAEVEEGELRFEIRNGSAIPLVIDELTLYNDDGFTAKNTSRFFAAGTVIATISDITIPPLQTTSVTIPLDNTGISRKIGYDGTASSPGTEEPATVYATDLIVVDIEGSVQLQSASAVLSSQQFTVSGEVEFDDSEFQLTSQDHYVEFSSGLLKIDNIINEIDLDIDTLIISFPGIRQDTDGTGRYREADSLWFEFSGSNRIRRGSDTQHPQPEIHQSLENVRIYAQGNKVTYYMRAVTENTRDAVGDDTVRTVRSTDRFQATTEIRDLEIGAAYGEIRTRVEFLGEDYDNNGALDIFNANEAEITELEDLEELSERLSGLRLVNPAFDLIYDTNIGVRGTVIAAILGVNDSGEEMYLSGKPGTEMEVRPGDQFDGLHAMGAPVPRSDLIRFELEPADNIGEVIRNQVIRFDSETTNVEDFLSNLPVELRFIGKILVNQEGGDGFLVNPVQLDAGMGIDIPINLSTAVDSPATLEDTLETDLSDLPSSEDDMGLSEATLFVMYENALPFDAGFTLEFLDGMEQVIATGTGQPMEPVTFKIDGAAVHPESRFVDQPTNGMSEIRLDPDQLDALHKTRYIRLLGTLATSRDDISGEVKVRTNDFIGLSINANIKTSVKVN